MISSITCNININYSKILFFISESILFIIISFIILLFVFISSFIPKFLAFLTAEQSLYGGIVEYGKVFIGKESPRSSGVSRSALIILVFLDLIRYFFSKNSSSIYTISRIILITGILLLQSRTVLILTIFYLVSFFYY